MKDKKKKLDKQVNPEVESLKAQLVRALADYDNLQKRVARENLEIYSRVKSQFVIGLLSPIEMLYNVQKHLNDPGLALSISQFEQVLSEEGIEKIEPLVGETFDENIHEAVDTVDDPNKVGTISEALQVGWKLSNGEVINHAKVKVYR